jgi:acetyl-CoA carboxylase biotin carboxyl carrier protein
MKTEEFDDLKQLIDLLEQHQVAEFDLDRGDVKLRLKFARAENSSALAADLTRLLASAPPAVAQAAAAVAPVPAPAASAEAGLHLVKSPIVGTFYASPSPGAAAFVNPGDRVEKGQVVAVIEAMKLMNEIEADAAGQVVKCLVSNGQPIEFGQPLFAIRLG